jgi:hypothetical protein
MELTNDDGRERAGVSPFGVGGANERLRDDLLEMLVVVECAGAVIGAVG